MWLVTKAGFPAIAINKSPVSCTRHRMRQCASHAPANQRVLPSPCFQDVPASLGRLVMPSYAF